MGRTIDEIIDTLPRERQQHIEERYQELKTEVESLQELRLVAGKAQAEIAAALKIKQPSVSKIEKQTDIYLSTLRRYVQAIGGELELTVRLPSRPPLHLRNLDSVLSQPRPTRGRKKSAKRERARA